MLPNFIDSSSFCLFPQRVLEQLHEMQVANEHFYFVNLDLSSMPGHYPFQRCLSGKGGYLLNSLKVFDFDSNLTSPFPFRQIFEVAFCLDGNIFFIF